MSTESNLLGRSDTLCLFCSSSFFDSSKTCYQILAIICSACKISVKFTIDVDVTSSNKLVLGICAEYGVALCYHFASAGIFQSSATQQYDGSVGHLCCIIVLESRASVYKDSSTLDSLTSEVKALIAGNCIVLVCEVSFFIELLCVFLFRSIFESRKNRASCSCVKEELSCLSC